MSEFRITEPGEYRMRNGGKLNITQKDDYKSTFPWTGYYTHDNGIVCHDKWRTDGRFYDELREHPLDAVGPWKTKLVINGAAPAVSPDVKTLRDEMAMAVLGQLTIKICGRLSLEEHIEFVAETSYKIADAMMEARKK